MPGIIIRTRATLDLPPPYTLVALRELDDAFAQACAIAGDSGAGTLTWVRRVDVAEFAVVLEPEEPLAQARRAFFAGMNALGDVLAARIPPEKPMEFDWPDAIRVDGGLVGGGRLGWPTDCAEHQVPRWLVFGAVLRVMLPTMDEPGMSPGATALEEEGFEQPDSGDLIESAARHLMSGFDTWNERGFVPIGEAYLARLSGRPGEAGLRRGIDAAGDLIVQAGSGAIVARSRLVEALATPSWLDPATGAPRT